MQRILPIFCLATLVACSPNYGNYAKVTDTFNAQMADDSAKEMIALYPPASTHIRLSQEVNDAYGEDLVMKLRESGYALEDGGRFGTLLNSTGSNTSQTDTSPAPPTTTKAFGYIVDTLGDDLYRVTLRIDTKIVSRVYRASGDAMVPAGAWTRKE